MHAPNSSQTACGRVAALGLSALLLAGAASPARAAGFDPVRPEVITLEHRSRDPRAVVLDDGTILAQWFHDETDVPGGNSAVVTCRIPKGAIGCESAPQTMLGGLPSTASALLQPDPAGAPAHAYAVATRIESPGGGVPPGFLHWVRETTDGGRTWSNAAKAAFNPGQQLDTIGYVHGPGVFRFSSMSSGFFEAGNYDGNPFQDAAVKLRPTLSPSSLYLWEGVALADNTTPVVAFLVDQQDGAGARLYTRRFTGSGSVNDAASWTPADVYAPPRGINGIVGFAGGPRGLYVAFREQAKDGCGARVAVARYDGTTFGAPVPVDADAHRQDVGIECSYGNVNAPGEPLAFTQDPAGNLRAVWTFYRAGSDPTMPDGLYSATSIDGGLTWSNPVRLYDYAEGQARLTLPNHNPPGIVSNAAGDAIVLGSGSAAHDRGVQLMRLPSIASAVAQPGPGSQPGTIQPPPGVPGEVSVCAKVKFGAVSAVATVGCWKKSGTKYSSSGPVRINGIDFKPLTGSGAQATFAAAGSTVSRRADRRAIRALRQTGGTEIVLDQATNTIKTSGAWRASASAVDLGRQSINWFVPPAGGSVLDDSTRQLARLDASQVPQRVLGLPVSGLVLPRFLADGTAQLPVNLQLPAPLGGLAGGDLTDNVTLTTDNGSGIQLARGAISLELPKVSLGIASIEPFNVTYNADPFVFQGQVGIKLPVIGSGIDASLVIQDGEFVDATAAYTPVPPIPVSAFAFLTRVGLHVFKGRSCKDPTGLQISTRFTGGPEIAGASLVSINGTASYRLPEGACNLPGVFVVSGSGSVVNIPVANVHLQYTTDGKLTFGAAIKLGPDSTNVSGSVDGGISLRSGDFFARGEVSVKVLNYDVASVEAILGSSGFGACARVKLTPIPDPIPGLPDEIDAGAAVRFRDTSDGDAGLTIYVANCSIDDLTPAEFAEQFSAGEPAVPTVEVAAGTARETFVAKSGASEPAPRFTLVGPGGERYATGDAQGATAPASGVIAYRDDGLHQASITVREPAKGAWRLEPAPGSASIVAAEGAAGAAAPRVDATIKRLGKPGSFLISYRAALPKRARMTFFDSSGVRLGNAIGTGRGTVRFTSDTGEAGRRDVYARIEGVAGPMAAPRVGSFLAPGAPAVGQPKAVRLRRGKTGLAPGLRVTWKPAAAAVNYVVRAELKDGRLLEVETKSGRRDVTIPAVPGFAAVTVRVYAIAKDGRIGRGAVAKAKPVNAKRRKSPK